MREMGSAPLALHITLQHAPGGPHFPRPPTPGLLFLRSQCYRAAGSSSTPYQEHGEAGKPSNRVAGQSGLCRVGGIRLPLTSPG